MHGRLLRYAVCLRHHHRLYRASVWRHIPTATSSFHTSPRALTEDIWIEKRKIYPVEQHTTPAVILDFSVDINDKDMEITWSDGSTSPYSFIWMRDNCQCALCFDPLAKSRSNIIHELDLNTEPDKIDKLSNNEVRIRWDDGHISQFTSKWLYERSFSPTLIPARIPPRERPRLGWGSEITKMMPTAKFSEVIKDDKALLDWLCNLYAYGLVTIEDAPVESGSLNQLADRVSFMRRTHYGSDFDVVSKPGHSNVAYTTGPLQLHTDMPCYHYKPGTQFLHCLAQHDGEGGETQIVNGSHVAMELKAMDRNAYDILCKIPVDWIDIGEESGVKFYKTLSLPVICTDNDGKITRINFSNAQRDSLFRVAPDQVESWYRAVKLYYTLLTHPTYVYTFKMKPGQIITYDNVRILHGRTGYPVSGHRHMHGLYVDWDEIYSRINVIEMQLNNDDS